MYVWNCSIVDQNFLFVMGRSVLLMLKLSRWYDFFQWWEVHFFYHSLMSGMSYCRFFSQSAFCRNLIVLLKSSVSQEWQCDAFILFLCSSVCVCVCVCVCGVCVRILLVWMEIVQQSIGNILVLSSQLQKFYQTFVGNLVYRVEWSKHISPNITESCTSAS